MADVLHIDDETYSDVDLRTRGLDNYTAHPSFEVMMQCWALNDEPFQLWFPTLEPCPPKLLAAYKNPKVQIKAWNAQFENVAHKRYLEKVIGVAVEQTRWRCSMVRAMMLALPPKLEECGKVLKLSEHFQKNSEGMRLIRLFCVPHEPTKAHPYRRYTKETHPKEWEEFCRYCLQDGNSERKIDKILSKFPVPEREWEVYALDQKINYRGVPIDVEFVRAAIDLIDRRKKQVNTDLRKLTKLPNPNSGAQLLPWLRARGYPFSNLKKEAVKKALEDFGHTMTKDGIQALHHRQVAARSSVTKFNALLRRVGKDGRLRFNFQMAGAGRTLRWAGRGVQLQNLARPPKHLEKHLAEIRRLILARDYETIQTYYGDIIDVLAASVRGAIAVIEGKTLTISDLNAIETRLTGWISGCQPLNNVFAQGLCPYKTFAAQVYRIDYDDVSKDQRQINKPAVLGCGFMLSGGAEVGEYPEVKKTGLWAYAESMGVKLTKAEAHAQVQLYRNTYVEVTELWEALKEGVIRAMNTRQPTRVGVVEFDTMSPFLRMKLPSGRYIYYLRPVLSDQTVTHPGGTFVTYGLSYEGKNKIGKWTRVTTHGGKLVENICQAVARDILVEGLLAADADGFDIVGHVHDEIITEGLELDIECTHERLSELMSIVPAWADGLHLGANGFSSPFYKKD